MKNLRKSPLRTLLRVLMALCVVGIICSVSILFSVSREYADSDATYQQLRIIRELSKPQNIDFTSLERINPDMVGWLSSEDGVIDYPVVRGKDNTFYLHHMFTGEPNKTGSIFMDYRNNINFSDKITIVYGHNMKDGSMFSSLTNYKDQQYYDRFPTLQLFTPVGNFTIELFAGIVTDGDYESVRIDFVDDQDYKRYIDSIKEISTFQSEAIIGMDDKIVVLSTCSYEFNNARYVLYGKLIPIL